LGALRLLCRFDRDLTVAGRVLVREGDRMVHKLVSGCPPGSRGTCAGCWPSGWPAAPFLNVSSHGAGQAGLPALWLLFGCHLSAVLTALTLLRCLHLST
jgi:hypothetical protein